jgi:hypothetical protein
LELEHRRSKCLGLFDPGVELGGLLDQLAGVGLKLLERLAVSLMLGLELIDCLEDPAAKCYQAREAALSAGWWRDWQWRLYRWGGASRWRVTRWVGHLKGNGDPEGVARSGSPGHLERSQAPFGNEVSNGSV